ncbi:phage tail tube protein [Bacteroides thetaiotaomicron]|uniref:phage tail tube protein n=1 Tax=Bacteroides thetaiotaomicron TaxID=818 RepID=UPI003563DB05
MSKAKAALGKDLMLFAESKALALATSCKLGLSAETIDTQSKDSGIWTEKDIKKLSWNASSDNLFSADADANSYDKLFALFIAHKPITLNFGIVANANENEMPVAGWTLAPGSYTGKAVITSLEANAPDGDKATFSISFEGTGPLKKETTVPASK